MNIFNMFQCNFRERLMFHKLRLCKHTVTVGKKIEQNAPQCRFCSTKRSCNCIASTTHRGLMVITLHLNILTKNIYYSPYSVSVRSNSSPSLLWNLSTTPSFSLSNTWSVEMIEIHLSNFLS